MVRNTTGRNHSTDTEYTKQRVYPREGGLSWDQQREAQDEQLEKLEKIRNLQKKKITKKNFNDIWNEAMDVL